MYPIKEVTDVELAFPASVLHLMPPMDEIPDEFDMNGGNPWKGLFEDMFYRGLDEIQLIPRDGVKARDAFRQIKAIMGSFEPKHEHKTSACAFLLNEWFRAAKWKVTGGEEKNINWADK